MKIAAIDELEGTAREGGAARVTRELAAQLSSTGRHVVDVYSFRRGLQVPLPSSLKYQSYLRELLVLPFVGRRSLPRLEDPYDILLVSSPTLLALYSPRKPVVLYLHCLYSRQVGLFGRFLPSPYRVLFNRLLEILFARLERRALQDAVLILCPKEPLAEYLRRNPRYRAKTIEILPVGVDLQKYSPIPLSKRSDYLLFVGRATPAKGFPVFARLADGLKMAAIAVVPRETRFSTKALRKSSYLQVIVAPPERELIELYQKASIFVMPSISETGPLVTLEAMSCGLPIVCTPEGGGDYVVDGDNAFVVRHDEFENMRERIAVLKEDESLRARMAEASRRNAQRFSEKHTVMRLEELLSRALQDQ